MGSFFTVTTLQSQHAWYAGRVIDFELRFHYTDFGGSLEFAVKPGI